MTCSCESQHIYLCEQHCRIPIASKRDESFQMYCPICGEKGPSKWTHQTGCHRHRVAVELLNKTGYLMEEGQDIPEWVIERLLKA